MHAYHCGDAATQQLINFAYDFCAGPVEAIVRIKIYVSYYSPYARREVSFTRRKNVVMPGLAFCTPD